MRKQQGHRRADQREDQSEVWNKLESSGQQRPEWRERNSQNEERHQPHDRHCQRVIALRDEPALEGSEGDIRVIADRHTPLMLKEKESFRTQRPTVSGIRVITI